jgi:hypothetical protein
MVYFQTKIPNLDKLLMALNRKRLVYFLPFRNICLPFSVCSSWTFGNLVVVWYILPRFGIFWQEKSGNPGRQSRVLSVSDGEKLGSWLGIKCRG